MDHPRSQWGLPRLREQSQEVLGHPGEGGSRGYPVAQRIELIHAKAMRRVTTGSFGASDRSIRRWANRVVPFKSTGNKAMSKINGIHQRELILYRIAYPKATADEVRRYLYEDVPGLKLFSRSDISKAETRVGLTRKCGSTTAWQAYEPRNILRRDLYWSVPPPLGIVGVHLWEFVDFDECAIFFTTPDRSIGKAYSGVRVREPGPHGYDEKWTIMMAIDPGGFVHMRIDTNKGTSSMLFAAFVAEVNKKLRGTGRRTFIWDNLTAHHSDMVNFAVMMAGNRIVPRAPYSPIDGPIEFVFNQLECQLKLRLDNINTETDMIREIYNIVANLRSSFGSTFAHCGY
jgi:transposase